MSVIDLNKDRYLRIYRKTMDNSICFLAHWELTYKCNLKCRHCYVSSNEKRREFSFEKAKSIIDELKSMNCLYLSFSGGEILMRDDFFEIASYARKQGFALRLMTNATLIDEVVSQRIAALYPLSVDISIYAAEENLHDAITSVRGSFDKTIKAVVLLKQSKIRVVLKFLIMQDNIQEFPAVSSLAEGMGVDFLFDFCIVTKDKGSVSPLKYRLNKEQIKDFFVRNNMPLKKEADKEALLCSAGLNNIFITPYLDVYPCVGFKTILGNLYRQGLKDVWSHSKKLNFIRNIRLSDLTRCQRCALIQFCHRCFGMALVEDADMLGPSSFDCLVAEVISEIVDERKELINYER